VVRSPLLSKRKFHSSPKFRSNKKARLLIPLPDEGNLEQILHWILCVNEDNSHYLDFLLCYKYLGISALDLLAQVYEIYQEQFKEISSQPKLENWRIGSFLQKWILVFYYRDFSSEVDSCDAKRAFHLLKAILRTFWTDGLLKETEELQASLIIAKNVLPQRIHTIQTSSIQNPIALDISSKYTPIQVATQLTVIDYQMLKNITEDELCSLGWDKKDNTISPNINSMVDRWNKIAMWVSTEIISAQKNDKRKIIKWFLTIGEKLNEMHNFHSLFALIGGLNNVMVSRFLEMKALGTKTRQRKYYLENLMNTDNNWAIYRDRLKESEGLVIPYIGLFMKDILVVMESKTKAHNGYINFVKLRVLQQILTPFYQYRTQQCSLEKDTLLMESLSKLFIKTEKELYQFTSPKSLIEVEQILPN
jgi:hypothetical protein